jgi:hypothetical protein
MTGLAWHRKRAPVDSSFIPHTSPAPRAAPAQPCAQPYATPTALARGTPGSSRTDARAGKPLQRIHAVTDGSNGRREVAVPLARPDRARVVSHNQYRSRK